MERNPKLWDTRKGASKLNEAREEVIGLFRDGLALAKIAQQFNMSASGVMNWLKAQGEYDREVKCELPECDETFPFRPRKSYCSRLHVRRANARERNARPDEKLKNAARNKLRRALYDGRVSRPSSCERCGAAEQFAEDGRSLIQADHHHGYDEVHALDVWWICTICDAEVEKLRKQGRTVNRGSPGGRNDG